MRRREARDEIGYWMELDPGSWLKAKTMQKQKLETGDSIKERLILDTGKQFHCRDTSINVFLAPSNFDADNRVSSFSIYIRHTLH